MQQWQRGRKQRQAWSEKNAVKDNDDDEDDDNSNKIYNDNKIATMAPAKTNTTVLPQAFCKEKGPGRTVAFAVSWNRPFSVLCSREYGLSVAAADKKTQVRVNARARATTRLRVFFCLRKMTVGGSSVHACICLEPFQVWKGCLGDNLIGPEAGNQETCQLYT